MENTEVSEMTELKPFDAAEGNLADPYGEAVMIDPFGLPFESMDEFSDAPLEFEELAETLWKVLNDTYILSVKYNRQSPYYLKLCSHLEKDIKQLGSLCVTKAVLEQKDMSFPKLEGMTVRELYAMVSLHFRKCRQAFEDIHDAGKGYDMGMLDRICRWALLAERLKATEEKIRRIRSGKINADRLLEQAQTFQNEPRGERPQRDPQEIRKAASLPIISSFASEIIRNRRKAERQRIREEKAREKERRKTGPYTGFRQLPIYPPIPINDPVKFEKFLRKELLHEAREAGDKAAIEVIKTENLEELKQRWHDNSAKRRSEGNAAPIKTASPPPRSGPSDEVRKKLREQRKKKKH